MSLMKNKSLPIIAAIFIIELSIILSWFWMTGDYDEIRFGVWPMSEWLVNYQGGFVRRGLFGELIYRINQGQGLINALNHITFYFYFLYCLIFCAVYYFSKIRNIKLFIITLLIPGGIYQMAISASFFTRKEILFLLLFGMLCLIYLQAINKAHASRVKWYWIFGLLSNIGASFLMLTHEGYFFMSYPFVVTLYWIFLKENLDSKILKSGFLIYIFLIPAIFIFCIFHHGDPGISQNIWDSLSLSDRLILSPASPYTVYGAIGGIGWGQMQNLSTLYGVLVSGGWIYWIFFTCGNYIILMYIFANIFNDYSNTRDGKISSFFVLISIPIFVSCCMFVIGSDWGRWIASSSNHALLLGFSISAGSLFKSKAKAKLRFSVWPNYLLQQCVFSEKNLFIGILTYELIFKMPECCVQFPYIFIQYNDMINVLFGLIKAH